MTSKIRKLYETMRDRMFGRATEEVETTILPTRRLNRGPCTSKYIKTLFPKGVFRKKLTPCRVDQVRMVFRTLRPEQKAIARARSALPRHMSIC